MRSIRLQFLVLSLGFCLGLLGIPSAGVNALPAATVSLTPAFNCPSSGCAAGQRLNFKANYSFSQLDVSKSPTNVQVCIFTPVNWTVVPPIEFASKGLSSNQAYSYDISHCTDAAPSQYSLAGGASGKVLDKSVGDALTFAFRLGATTSANGAVLARVYEQNATSQWVKINDDVQFSIGVVARGTNAFVASDSTGCGSSAPCYVNSSDDQANGIGTGLKDAIDAAITPATITLLGTVNLKSNDVLVNQSHQIKGNGSSGITYAGTACDKPLLTITAGATISGLVIDDGACASPSRDLILVNSTAPVTIESNNLANGKNAITAGAGNAALTVRYNHVTGNSGYAIQINNGTLEAVANNFVTNGTGAQVNCGSSTNRTADHNYWGAGVLASAGASNCTVSDPKRLGAEIFHNSAGPGLQVQKVTVNATPQSAFGGAVRFNRSATGADFGLYIVNHGSGSPSNIPFSSGQAGNLQACSNYWDIFFADSAGPVDPTTFDLYFKYNLNTACITAVESAQYCGQAAAPSRYPLWWYDLGSGNWITTGAVANGQPTTCDSTSKELKVSLDGIHGRPWFADLQRLPFVVGIPAQPVSVTFSTFAAQPGNTLATLSWTTTNEINMAGYFIQRSTSADVNTFADITALQPRKGSGSGGASYTFTDPNLVNNTPYYYRIRVVGYDGSSGVSGVTSVTPIPPTPTITLTPSKTPIPPTATRTLTLFPTSTFIFRTATRTATQTATPTSPFMTITNTPSNTPTSLTRSATPSPTPPTGTPVPTTAEASTELASTRQARTQEALALMTPTATPDAGQTGTGAITTVMAVLAVGALLGGAFYLIREQRMAH